MSATQMAFGGQFKSNLQPSFVVRGKQCSVTTITRCQHLTPGPSHRLVCPWPTHRGVGVRVAGRILVAAGNDFRANAHARHNGVVWAVVIALVASALLPHPAVPPLDVIPTWQHPRRSRSGMAVAVKVPRTIVALDGNERLPPPGARGDDCHTREEGRWRTMTPAAHRQRHCLGSASRESPRSQLSSLCSRRGGQGKGGEGREGVAWSGVVWGEWGGGGRGADWAPCVQANRNVRFLPQVTDNS